VLDLRVLNALDAVRALLHHAAHAHRDLGVLHHLDDFRHALRASLTPIVTLFGLDIALLVGGAIITESVFNYQGLGWITINAALQQDLPVVLGSVICTATAVALMNLVVDIVYAFLDPRVRYT